MPSRRRDWNLESVDLLKMEGVVLDIQKSREKGEDYMSMYRGIKEDSIRGWGSCLGIQYGRHCR
jgi:hypothetical protein